MINKKIRRRLWAEMDEQGVTVVAMLDLYGALASLFEDMEDIQIVASQLDGEQATLDPTDVSAARLVEAFRISVMYFLQSFLPLWDLEDDDPDFFVNSKTPGHLEGIRTEAKAQVLSFLQDLELEPEEHKDIHAEDLWAAMSLAILDPYHMEEDEEDEVDALTDEIARKLRGDEP